MNILKLKLFSAIGVNVPLFLKNIIISLTLLFFSLIVAFGIIEASLRIIGFTYPAWEIRDPQVGFIGLPNAKGIWTTEGDGGWVSFNNFGFRDKDRSLKKPEGAYRIAVIGDSFIQAREVNPEQTFTRQTEELVQSCTPSTYKNVEVMNFGVGGYNTAAELQLLRSRVLAFKPDMVLLAFFIGNDIHRNHPKMDLYRYTSGIGMPLFQINDGKVSLDMSFLNDPVFQEKMKSKFHQFMLTAINYSVTLQFLNYTRHNFKGWINMGGIAHGGNRSVNNEYQEPDPTGSNAEWIREQIWIGNNLSMYPPKDQLWDEAWKMTEYGIETMITESKRENAKFTLMMIPHPPQVHWANGEPPVYPQNRIKTLSERFDVPVIDLLPGMRAHYLIDHKYLFGFGQKQRGDGHWNQQGQKLAAQIASQRLCDILSK